MDCLVTNKLAQDDAYVAEQESNVRWLIEQFHCEAKQLTGLQACQCRPARSQRNHIALALRVWTWLITQSLRSINSNKGCLMTICARN